MSRVRSGAIEAVKVVSASRSQGQPSRSDYVALSQDAEGFSASADEEDPERRPKGQRHAAPRIACAFLGGAALASAAWASWRELRRRHIIGTRMQDATPCGVDQEDVEFFTEVSSTRATFVSSADACREECETGRHCLAWTWGAGVGCLLKATGENDHLVGRPAPRELLRVPPASPRPGVVSGVPCAVSEHHLAETDRSASGVLDDGLLAGADPTPARGLNVRMHSSPEGVGRHKAAARSTPTFWLNDPATATATASSSANSSTAASAAAANSSAGSTSATAAANYSSAASATAITTTTSLSNGATTRSAANATPLAQRTTPVVFPPGSLFCFSLMVPNSYEQDLLLMQHYIGASIFACEEAAIYSNMVINLAPGLQTRFVNSTLTCETGGEFKTALNNEIFMAVWKKLVSDGRYLLHDWTVKVDPDTVFLPSMLRQLLRKYQPLAAVRTGVYINNCKYGMHGPLEVLSINAVKTWGAGAYRCIEHFEKLCGGRCLWGEDMFLDQCLSKVLHVRRIDEFRVLTEDHCDPPPEWQRCSNKSQAAFHPFKTLRGYQQCLSSTSAMDDMDETALRRSLQMFDYQ